MRINSTALGQSSSDIHGYINIMSYAKLNREQAAGLVAQLAVRRTYMQYSEQCEGREFDPRLDHFLDGGIPCKCDGGGPGVAECADAVERADKEEAGCAEGCEVAPDERRTAECARG